MDDLTDQQSHNKDLKCLASDIKKIKISGIANLKLDREHEDLLTKLIDSDSFDEEIEQILANFNEETMDLTKLQTQIILLLKRHIANLKIKNQKLKQDLAIDEKLVTQNIAEISKYLIDHHIKIKSDLELRNNDDSYQNNLTQQSRQDLKKIIKNFAVYQLYQVMNPRRIAGETRRDNFIHNMLVGGMNRAKHYSGGSKQEIASYSPQFIKYLENKSGTSAKNKGRLI